jgi:hypothetical protein
MGPALQVFGSNGNADGLPASAMAGFEVRVVDYCVSSCANYVFVAAKTKRVLSGGTVAWHGNALQHDSATGIDETFSKSADRDKARAYLRAMRSKQAEFFERVGVNECICRVGNEWLGAAGLYSMSKADMERFGVTNILDAPTRSEDIAADVRRKLDLSFVTVPPGFQRRTVCP